MRKLKFYILCLTTTLSCHTMAQDGLHLSILDSASRQPVSGASVRLKPSSKAGVTDSMGRMRIGELTLGSQQLTITAINYQEKKINITLPYSGVLEILLIPISKTMEDVVIVSSTRTNTRMENSPMKVEVLGQEEMNEENQIKPGNIASILGDVSGIQIQQSSAVSGNANVRIQGLDGRYTQILRDGMPLFEGFSGGFGILQIPPLDLKQVELIKGSASTLYGGGAIGGLINLISKKPKMEQEAMLTLNQTSLKESNINTYIAKRWKTFGYSFFGGYTRQKASDVNGDGLSDLPDIGYYILHPKLFFYPTSHTTISLGFTHTAETRNGGDMQVLNGKVSSAHSYFEKNTTGRDTWEFQAEHKLGAVRLTLKAMYSDFERRIQESTLDFKGRQRNYYTELSGFVPFHKADLVAGINFTGDSFTKLPSDPIPVNEYRNNIFGVFGQYTWHIKDETLLEAGLRYDHHAQYGNFLLPRIALFHRFNDAWATRWGVGWGYKTPNPLAPQNVEYPIEKIQPIGPSVVPEHSLGVNAELNWRKNWSKGNKIFINLAFFLTNLSKPIIASQSTFNGDVNFSNWDGPVVSAGADMYVNATVQEWELYVGYTYTDARRHYLPGNPFVVLTPRNRMAFVIGRNIGENWLLGLEGSYNGTQYRDGDVNTPGYMFMAAMIRRKIGEHLTLVLNGENLLNYRQSDHETLFTGPITQPVFKPLWAPIDGRSINLSLRIGL